MLEILKSRYRFKYDKNFMRLLDACYCYYEPMLGKKITETDTIETLISPATMLTEYQSEYAPKFTGVESIILGDYKNPALCQIKLTDDEVDEMIHLLKSKYSIIAYNTNQNMLDKSCKNLPWKLEFSNHYADDSGDIIQFNELDDLIEVVRACHDNISFRHISYPKYDPIKNNDESTITINDFDLDRVSNGVYKKYDVDGRRITIYDDGKITITYSLNSDISNYAVLRVDDDIRSSLVNNTTSIYVCRNSIILFDLSKPMTVIWNIPYDITALHNFNHITCNESSVEFVEILSRVARPDWMQTLCKLDTPTLAKAYTNGHRIFTDNEIFMARNELSRVLPSSHYGNYTFTGEKCGSLVYEKGIEYTSMLDGTFVMNACTGVSEDCVKVNDRYYTIIRNVDEEQNYLAWSDDNHMWMAITRLPDCIDKIECELCDNFYIVMRDTGSYLWAYSLDLGFMTIS